MKHKIYRIVKRYTTTTTVDPHAMKVLYNELIESLMMNVARDGYVEITDDGHGFLTGELIVIGKKDYEQMKLTLAKIGVNTLSEDE